MVVFMTQFQNDKNNVLIYGAWVLFAPKHKLDPKIHIRWTDSIHLTESFRYLHGPFNVDSRLDVIIAKIFIALRHWEYTLTICDTFSIVPPILSTLTAVKASVKR